MATTHPLVRKEISGLEFVLDLLRRYPGDRVILAWVKALATGQRHAGVRIVKLITVETTLN